MIIFVWESNERVNKPTRDGKWNRAFSVHLSKLEPWLDRRLQDSNQDRTSLNDWLRLDSARSPPLYCSAGKRNPGCWGRWTERRSNKNKKSIRTQKRSPSEIFRGSSRTGPRTMLQETIQSDKRKPTDKTCDGILSGLLWLSSWCSYCRRA